MTSYRIAGTTDDVTDCQREGCPMTGLRRTIVLDVLDADGNPVDRVYYGSDCAEKVTGMKAGRIRTAAAIADRDAEAARAFARSMLRQYPADAPAMTNAVAYNKANPGVLENLAARGGTLEEFVTWVADRVAEWHRIAIS